MKSYKSIALVLAATALMSFDAEAQTYFQNTTGLLSPANTITFSEFAPPPDTSITLLYQSLGVTFSPQVYYAPTFDQNFGTPNIDPTASVGNFIQFSPALATFSILFNSPVSSAAFAMMSEPGTFELTPYLNGFAVDGPHTFIGDIGPGFTSNFVGLTGINFDELRIGNVSSSDNAFVFDNLQFTPAPEPGFLGLLSAATVTGLLWLGYRSRKS